jgi:hypothetical protein
MPADLGLQDTYSQSSSPSPGAGLRLGDYESAEDAVVDALGLHVDAEGVNLQQDRDAVPGSASDFGRGHPGVLTSRSPA